MFELLFFSNIMVFCYFPLLWLDDVEPIDGNAHDATVELEYLALLNQPDGAVDLHPISNDHRAHLEGNTTGQYCCETKVREGGSGGGDRGIGGEGCGFGGDNLIVAMMRTLLISLVEGTANLKREIGMFLKGVVSTGDLMVPCVVAFAMERMQKRSVLGGYWTFAVAVELDMGS